MIKEEFGAIWAQTSGSRGKNGGSLIKMLVKDRKQRRKWDKKIVEGRKRKTVPRGL